MKHVDILGHLKGKKASIIIGESAHVNTITIGGNAEIEGDIISFWKPNSLFVQRPVGKELHTKLYFGAKKAEGSEEVVADSQYNGILRGNISDKSFGFEVHLMGGTLN